MPYILLGFVSLSFGLVNFVLMPIFYASVYASYKDIFVDTSETE